MAAHVYSRFEVIKVDGAKVKLRTQDMRPQDKDNLIAFMHKYFVYEENYFRHAGIANSQAALEEITFFFNELVQDERTCPVVCYVDHEDENKVEIVGYNMFYIKKREDEEDPPIQTEELKTLFRIISENDTVYDLSKNIDVDEHLYCAGLSVNPSYRGCGIATELLKARKPIMHLRGFKITGVWLTSIGSQKAGVKAGYEEVAEMSYEELGRRVGITFTDCPPTTKYMILRA